MPLVRYGQYYSLPTTSARIFGDEALEYARAGRLDVIPMSYQSTEKILSIVVDEPYKFIEVKLSPQDRDDLVRALLEVEVV